MAGSPLEEGAVETGLGGREPNIAEPLERLGNVSQAVIQPAISGAEVTRLSMYRADALKELGAGYDALGQGIASGVNAALKGVGAGASDDMARQGALAGRSAVTRDANGDIQVQPPTGELFGLKGKAYANAVSDGTQQQITTNLNSDLQELAAKNAGNPEAFKAASSGYIQGHLGGLGSGTAGQTSILDAKDHAQQLYDHMLTAKSASDIGQARGALEGTISQTQNDLVALANGGMAGSDEFNKTLGRQSDAYNSLTSNPSFGVSSDMEGVRRKDNSLAVTTATIQGSMSSAFQQGGLNAAAAVIPTIADYPGASEADKVQLTVAATSQLKSLRAVNDTAIGANKSAFETIMKSGGQPPLSTLQDFQNRANSLGDPDTAKAAATEITSHRYSDAVSTLSPSQHDSLNGVGQPPSQQPVTPGQSDPHKPGFDPNSVPFSGKPPTAAAVPAQGVAPSAADSMAPFRNAIASIESAGSGGYNAVGPLTKSGDRAYGAYQVMGANVPSWTKAALGYSMTPQQFRASPEAQDAVFNHQFGQYIQKYGPAGAASVWFSGRPGGGSVSDVTGTTANKYVSMFNARIGNAPAPEGGSQVAPAGATGAGGSQARPVSWEDIRNNPGMAPMYAQVMAKDGDVRTKTGETLLDSSTKALQNNIPPSQETMAQIEQLAADNPKLAEKYKEYEEGFKSYSLANQSLSPAGGGAPGGQPLLDQARAQALAQPDITQRQLVDKAQSLRDKSEALLKSDPVTAALNWKAIPIPPVPLDPSQPNTIPAHFSQNAQVVDALSAREPDISKSVVFPNETGRFGAAMAGPAQVGAAVLQSIGQLPPDKRDATLEMPEVRNAILGMANSPDAQKKQVAFSFMDQINRQDPTTFESKFGKAGLSKMMAWQDVEQYQSKEQIAKDAATAQDPAEARAQEAWADKSKELTKPLTASDVTSKISGQSWIGRQFNDMTPSGGAADILLDDYKRAHAYQLGVTHGNEAAADRYATADVSRKWGPSAANGRIMAYPPEMAEGYPTVNGSKDYVGSQLADDVHGMIAQTEQRPAEQQAMQRASYALIPDKQTESEFKGGQQPSYHVAVTDPDGRMTVLTGPNGQPFRWSADPRAAQAQAADAMQTQAQQIQERRAHMPALGEGIPLQ